MNNPSTIPSQEQQLSWGRALASAIAPWPQLQHLAKTVGITANPTDLTPILNRENTTDGIGPLSAFLTLIENAMDHQANQADTDNLDWQTKVTALQVRIDTDNLDWQTKVTALQVRIDELTDALTRAVGGRESGSGRRISEDPDKFGGIEKDIAKRQQQYVTWRSQIQRCFGMDEHIFNTEFRRIQHIASLLKDDAYDIHQENFETVTDNPTDPSRWHWQTHKDVFKTLNDQYATLDLSRQAGIDFDNLWMTNKPFQNFITKFNKLATKSGRTDVQKVETLKVKVSQELSDVALNRSDKPGPADFEGWCKLFQNIYQDLQEKDHLRNNRPSARRTPAVPTQPSPAIIPAATNAGDPMVLDARRRPSREQCAQEGLCFYCKQPGHSRDNCVEKQKNDAKFGRPGRPQFRNQAGRGTTVMQPYMPRPRNPMTRFPSQLGLLQNSQFSQPNPYSRLRATEGGFVEEEVASTMSPSLSPSTFTPLSTTPTSTSNINKPGNGSPLA
jgi:hypothetical protein